jgi:hypothetical protein
LSAPFAAPEFRKSSFNCPQCGAYAQQHWFVAFKTVDDNTVPVSFSPIPEVYASVCAHCGRHTLWYFPPRRGIPRHVKDAQPEYARRVEEANRARMIFPLAAQGPLPSADLPEEIRRDFLEARSIAPQSPRGASALLRLCIQKLCVHLGEPGKDLNADIGALVRRGLPQKIQQALDTVRVVGNGAVHPGELDLRDDLPTALRLLELINMIADVMITQPKRVEALYERVLTPGQKEQIAKRDAPEDGPETTSS